MPVYDFLCPCGQVSTQFRRLLDRDMPTVCECGQRCSRVVVYKPFVAPDYPGYESPATGQWVEGRRAHKEDLARSGCRIREPGETEAFMKRAAERQQRYEKNVEAVVDAAATDIGLA